MKEMLTNQLVDTNKKNVKKSGISLIQPPHRIQPNDVHSSSAYYWEANISDVFRVVFGWADREDQAEAVQTASRSEFALGNYPGTPSKQPCSRWSRVYQLVFEQVSWGHLRICVVVTLVDKSTRIGSPPANINTPGTHFALVVRDLRSH